VDSSAATKALEAGLDRVIAAESDITHYDTIVGDGDCGIGLRRGAEAIKAQIKAGKLKTTDAIAFLDVIISSVETDMDGTSGALYAIFLNALSAGLQKSSGSEQVGTAQWAEAADAALKSLGKYTPATVGDRTLVDALQPFIEELKSSKDVRAAAKAAKAGSDKTKDMKASLGRSVYIGGDITKVPDPGAYGLAVFLAGLAEAC
jgi:dihydroxyacetone kinase